MSYWRGMRYKPVAERSSEARKKIEKLRKKNPDISPVTVEGRKIAKTWWGKAWNDNLKHYADYDNRIGRGRSYVKNGLVIHLEIKNGKLEAMVMGTRATPYKITVKIGKIPENRWNKIKNLSGKHLQSLTDLFDGKFPKELASVFSNKSEGVFPSIKEMKFNCSCPDWASMCKHVSASLFAVGARLDENPELVFELRGRKVGDLVKSAIKGEVEILRGKRGVESENKLSLPDDQLASLFGIKIKT